ncbi:hypothetical protein AAHE18_20G103400 [Arachis hypogaea]
MITTLIICVVVTLLVLMSTTMILDHGHKGIHQAGSPMTNPSGTAEAHKVGDPPKQASSIPILQ